MLPAVEDLLREALVDIGASETPMAVFRPLLATAVTAAIGKAPVK